MLSKDYMREVLSLIMCFFSLTTIYSQKIIVNGKESIGKLKWEDFTGDVDKNSKFQAFTFYDYKYSYRLKPLENNLVLVENFNTELELNPEKSWYLVKNATEELLSHEQGHFNIGILATKELRKSIENKKFNKNTFKNEIQDLIRSIDKKYQELGVKYDKETSHSSDRIEQKKWDAYFKKELPELY